VPYNDYLRAYALFRQLPKLALRVDKLEKNQPGHSKPEF
jgi:hypothetical protein